MASNTSKRWRARWLAVHLYLGLSVGMVMSVVGLTGSVMAFWQTFDTWLNPRLLNAMPLTFSQTGPTAADWVAAAERALPENAKLKAIYFPCWQRDRLVLTARYQLADASEYELYVNPNTGGVSGSRLLLDPSAVWRAPAMELIVQIHQSLLLGSFGEHLVAVSALLAMVSIATGVWLWWPKPGKWRWALTLKAHAGPQRRIYDFHKLNGVYAGLFIAVMLISGVAMYEPEGLWIKAAAGALSTLHRPPDNLHSVASPGAKPISVTNAVAVADELAPGGQFNWLHAPLQPDGVIEIVKVRSTNGTGNQVKLMLDQYTGKELWRFDYNAASAGDTFLTWLYPLHAGYGLGLPGRIFVSLIGLTCPTLLATGMIRWFHKRRAAIRKSLRT
ncbi:PepSY-associated TM helix domain-containing protein [Methylomonas sp. TEB]|uniref:PepSY-associated TM helix domain-containing protein n=1 Tax=Methylomonas sp. TEB TaxID=3398229 RepID=UPI0039F607E6